MKNVVWCIVLIQLFAFSSTAQNWEGIGEFNGYADHFAVDTINDVLYIAGGFNKINNTLNVQGICKYDGSLFTTVDENALLPDFGNNFMAISDMVMYQGSLYVASSEYNAHGSIEGTPVNSHVMRFNGEQWESVFPDFPNCQSLRVLDSKLYLFSSWGTFSNNSHFIRVFDGADYVDFLYQSPYWQFQSGNAGSMMDILPIDSGYVLVGDISYTTFEDEFPPIYGKDVFYWDGESIVNTLFNDGLRALSGTGSSNRVRRIVRFQDEIYIGGLIFSYSNVEGNGVVRAGNDGIWHSLSGNPGSGSTPDVEDMMIYNDMLWIVGKLNQYESEAFQDEPMYLSNILLWDGSAAYRPSNDVFPDPSFLYDITVFRDTVYVAGGFQFINVEPIASVARFIGNLEDTMVEVPLFFEPIINVYPNPTTQFLTLTSPSLLPGTHITAYNLAGQQVYSHQLAQSHDQFTLDARQFGPAGMYLLHVQPPGEAAVVKKVVVQE